MLSSVHNAFDVRIFYKEARTLAQHGYEVFYVVPHERDEVRDNVHILAVPRPANRLIRMTKTVWQCYRRAAVLKADVYHFHDPELLPVGWLLKKGGSKVIYDAHEDLSRDVLSKEWIPGILRKIVAVGAGSVELKIASWLDYVVAATPSICEKFRKKGIPCVDILNLPLVSEFVDDREVHSRGNREKAVCYVGDITVVRGIRELVQAVMRAGCRLLLAGRVSSPSLTEVIEVGEKAGVVEYLGFVEREALVDKVFRRAMAGAVLFHPVPNHVESIPNKIFEYMAAGLPVIASSFPLWKQLIEGEGCGICVDPLDVEQVAEAIRWLVNNPETAREMGERGKKAVIEKYRWDTQAKKLVELYEYLLR